VGDVDQRLAAQQLHQLHPGVDGRRGIGGVRCGEQFLGPDAEDHGPLHRTLERIFPPAIELELAALANLGYCAAYLVDIPVQQSSFGITWRRRRWVLWSLGTLFALLIEYYWIADEIYPSVGAA
jgi:hypothetical protein